MCCRTITLCQIPPAKYPLVFYHHNNHPCRSVFMGHLYGVIFSEGICPVTHACVQWVITRPRVIVHDEWFRYLSKDTLSIWSIKRYRIQYHHFKIICVLWYASLCYIKKLQYFTPVGWGSSMFTRRFKINIDDLYPLNIQCTKLWSRLKHVLLIIFYGTSIQEIFQICRVFSPYLGIFLTEFPIGTCVFLHSFMEVYPTWKKKMKKKKKWCKRFITTSYLPLTTRLYTFIMPLILHVQTISFSLQYILNNHVMYNSVKYFHFVTIVMINVTYCNDVIHVLYQLLLF